MARSATALVLLCLFLFLSATGYSQLCRYKLDGIVTDKQQLVIPGAIVRLPADSAAAATDTDGHFNITGLCPGTHTLICTYPGYTSFSIAVDISSDVHLKITLSANELGEVTVNGKRLSEIHSATQTELSGKYLLQTRGQSLGESLKELPGLNSIQTGPSLSKPVIHGLHSNRVLIMNDGVRQEGQQWGSEHAPEIDPFVANRISVIKGAASVRYGSDAIAGVVLLSPDALPVSQGLSGDIYLIGASNGRMGAVSGALQGSFGKSLKGLSWRIQGTTKEAGNFHAPRYYLLNTGLREGDVSVDVGYKHKGFDFNVYYSQYNTTVGICLDAQSGNYKELLRKLSSNTPDDPSYFTYSLDRPYQTVYHDLLKASASYTFPEKGKLEITFGRQSDKRKEYDDLSIVVNPAAEHMPQLSFELTTHTVDVIYTEQTKNKFSGSYGFTGNTSGNVFEGVRYLIPNFRNYDGGAFAIERYNLDKFSLEAGIRYDYRWLRVYQLNPTTLETYNTTYDYRNATATIGSTYRYNEHFSANINIGTGWRAPSINEMYINGEHFSDASFEIGDSALKSERSFNTGLSINYKGGKLRATVDIYGNYINSYIFDTFSHEVRVLSSGSFPVFRFGQANVNIHGVDIALQYDILSKLTLQSKTTIVRGYNFTIHDFLVGMPSDRFDNGIEYHFPKIGNFSEPYVSIENSNVLKQTRTHISSELAPPPAGYSVFNANAGFTLPVKRNSLNVNVTVNNIMNTPYRDYLDHFRYYVDELGINYILRLKYSF